MVEDTLSITGFNNPALLHHHNLVGNIGHHCQVVADENYADIAFGLQLRNQLQDLGLDGDVQRGSRFVGN